MPVVFDAQICRSVGVIRMRWMRRVEMARLFAMPIIAETWSAVFFEFAP